MDLTLISLKDPHTSTLLSLPSPSSYHGVRVPDVSPVPVQPVDDGLVEEQREGAVRKEPRPTDLVQTVAGRHPDALQTLAWERKGGEGKFCFSYSR